METMGSKKRRPRRSFTPEFKAEIVELCQRGDRSVRQVASDFDLTETAVRQWVSANAVIGNPAFATDRAEWDFMLVCTDYDEVVEKRIRSGRGLGGFLALQQKPGRPLVRAFVRHWRDVLDENARRLDFVSTALEHDPSIAEGLHHVREQYADLLPDSLIELGS